jgi:hypothetical protein
MRACAPSRSPDGRDVPRLEAPQPQTAVVPALRTVIHDRQNCHKVNGRHPSPSACQQCHALEPAASPTPPTTTASTPSPVPTRPSATDAANYAATSPAATSPSSAKAPRETAPDHHDPGSNSRNASTLRTNTQPSSLPRSAPLSTTQERCDSEPTWSAIPVQADQAPGQATKAPPDHLPPWDRAAAILPRLQHSLCEGLRHELVEIRVRRNLAS